MEKKVHDGYPILFSILHMCANFHQNRRINKVFCICMYSALKRQTNKFCTVETAFIVCFTDKRLPPLKLTHLSPTQNQLLLCVIEIVARV